jgi:hypothetical protein
MGEQTNQSQARSTNERIFVNDTSNAIARICLLPDPRPFYKKPWFGWGSDDTEACIERQMEVKSQRYNLPEPRENSALYRTILRQAEFRAAEGVAVCQVRDFEYPGSSGRYYGYRDGDGECQVTQNQAYAEQQRREHPQRLSR